MFVDRQPSTCVPLAHAERFILRTQNLSSPNIRSGLNLDMSEQPNENVFETQLLFSLLCRRNRDESLKLFDETCKSPKVHDYRR